MATKITEKNIKQKEVKITNGIKYVRFKYLHNVRQFIVVSRLVDHERCPIPDIYKFSEREFA